VPTYQKADNYTVNKMNELVVACFPELVRCKVTFEVIFAYPTLNDKGEAKGHAIAKNGLPVCAKSKKTSLADRAAGMADAVIYLDGDHWGKQSEKEQEAILFGQLYAFQVQTDDAGMVKGDDLGRPKLKILPPDFYAAGHLAVIEKYKEASPESKSLIYTSELVQKYFNWG